MCRAPGRSRRLLDSSTLGLCSFLGEAMNWSKEISTLPCMGQPKGVRKGCQPSWQVANHSSAILMVHGFTGSAGDFHHFTQRYQGARHDIFVPLLPGHGTKVEDLEPLTFLDIHRELAALTSQLLHQYRTLHLLGLSYGAVLCTRLSLEFPVSSLCLLAPAFFLRQQLDRKFRLIDLLRLQRFFKTRNKEKSSSGEGVSPFAYQSVPVGPATSFHHHTRMLRRRVHQVGVEVLHLHGTSDQTTPLAQNHRFLQGRLTNYRFQAIEGAGHVLPLSKQGAQVAELHQAWLKAVL